MCEGAGFVLGAGVRSGGMWGGGGRELICVILA